MSGGRRPWGVGGASAPDAARRRGGPLAEAAILGAAVSLASAALVSCSIDYGQATGGASEAALPTARFADYAHTVVVRGAKSFELRAATAEVYGGDDERTVLSDVAFSEYDPDTGELLSSGRAARAVFFPKTEDAEFSGAVRLESKRQDAILEGESLRWDGQAKRLEGGLDRVVKVSRSDGSWVSGAGFEADARRRSFVFRESVSGLVRSEEKE